MILRTSSCSTNSPRSAAAKPLSISRIEPFVVADETFHRFSHKRFRIATLFGGYAGKFSLQVGGKIYFHTFKVGLARAGVKAELNQV